MNELISHTSWMRDIPDDTPVTGLSIPGTHNSGCADGPLGFAQTQDLDLPDQLDAGIRFLDIRLALCEDNLFVHHDVVYMDKSYTDVLAICSSFLEKYPSETLLMSINDESRVDSGLGRFAPSEILGKLSRGDTTSRDRNVSFEDTFRAKTLEYLEKTPLYYNFAAHLDTSATPTPGFTPETTLGDVRGKIILLRRFEGGEDVGFDLTYWPENQNFRSATSPMYIVHDCYLGLEDGEKYELIIAHLEEAKSGDPKDLYITFSSAVDVKARGFAETINPRLDDYLAGSPKDRVGIIVMDYFEQPRELVSNVIKMN
ncbi:MAG: phosphatidylinositol-specific phospholipase C [Pseudonocardiaceae bacterium]